MGFSEYKKRVLPVLNSNNNIPNSIRLSDNGKTGISINVSIPMTCNPTKECMDYCYGFRGPIAFKASVALQAANARRLVYLETASEEEVAVEAKKIAEAVLKMNQNWFRWNGVGDLIPGSVRVINKIAELYPSLIQWVVTRKPEQVKNLSDRESIKILFSLDSSTPRTILDKAKLLKKGFKNAKFRFAWTRRDEKQAPALVNIIFNEHRGRKRLALKDERTCEATMPDNPHEGACDKCRRCFA